MNHTCKIYSAVQINVVVLVVDKSIALSITSTIREFFDLLCKKKLQHNQV